MGAKNNSQILLALILLSMLYSHAWTLPDLEAEILRKARHADGVSTSDISGLLDDQTPKDYSEFLIEKRASNDITGNKMKRKYEVVLDIAKVALKQLHKWRRKKKEKKKLLGKKT